MDKRDYIPLLKARFPMLPVLTAVVMLLAASVTAQSEVKTQAKEQISGWGLFRLGASRTEVIAALKKDPLLAPLEDPESDISEEVRDTLITLMPTRFFTHFSLQFAAGTCYLLRIVFSERYYSYIILYERLKKKYGDPAELDSRQAVWYYQSRRLILERPATVKYLDTSRLPDAQKTTPLPVEKDEYRQRDLFLENM